MKYIAGQFKQFIFSTGLVAVILVTYAVLQETPVTESVATIGKSSANFVQAFIVNAF